MTSTAIQGTIFWRLPDTESKHQNQITREKLGRNIARTFRNYKNLFPTLAGTDYESIAKSFCEQFFLTDFLSTNTAINAKLANLSLQDNIDKRIALSIRIDIHPIFNEHIPNNIAVAVIGYCPTATENPIFIPERVLLTHGQTEPTHYELQAEAVFQQLNEGQYPQRGTSNLLSPQFTKSLPKYGVKTQSRLKDWLDFLSFKDKLVKHKSQGLRYLKWEFNEEKELALYSATNPYIRLKPKLHLIHSDLFCRKMFLE